MSYQQVRYYRCINCKDFIKESREVYPFEGEIPDQNNCDLNRYSDYEIENGRLLLGHDKNHSWMVTNFTPEALAQEGRAPYGGLCDTCLKDETIKRLLPYINLNSNFKDKVEIRESLRALEVSVKRLEKAARGIS